MVSYDIIMLWDYIIIIIIKYKCFPIINTYKNITNKINEFYSASFLLMKSLICVII